MPTLETYRKQAKQLCRWHREENYSVGEKVRLLERFKHLTDRQVLDMPLPLMVAQEVVAVEAGFKDWAALKSAAAPAAGVPAKGKGSVKFNDVVPIFFVRDVTLASQFYVETLGFTVDFLHGQPPFYGSVSRDGVRLHLRYVPHPNFSELADREISVILASFEVSDVKALFEEFASRDAPFAQKLLTHPWGGTDFHIRDPDGNVFSFVQYRGR